MKKVRDQIRQICLARLICNHLLGENHSATHRYTIGIVIMSTEVGLTKAAFLVDIGFIHAIADLIGYGIHGVGALPFVEKVLAAVNNEKGD